ncbi:MAG: hypothetical protein HXS48_01050 [Theionarchaea archaeon]|nr:hypothetical protein [Theionarchaea archaeon]
MKPKIGRSKAERDIYVSLCIALLIILVFYALFHNRNTWKEDVNGDGVDEIIREIHKPDGTLDRYVTEEDGTIYKTMYNREGDIAYQWKIVPDPTTKDNIYIYVWDEKTKQWLPDQNQNGIPDEREDSHVFGF